MTYYIINSTGKSDEWKQLLFYYMHLIRKLIRSIWILKNKIYDDIVSVLIHGIDDEFMSIVIYDTSIRFMQVKLLWEIFTKTTREI